MQIALVPHSLPLRETRSLLTVAVRFQSDQPVALAVNVTASTPGVFTNTISPANISDTQNRNMAGNISANLTVSGLTVSKAFAPSTVNPNGVSTLTITLTNTNTVQLDGVSLNSDTLPGNTTNGVVIAPSPNASTTCTGGTVTAVAGTQIISMGGGIIPAQVGAVAGICTIDRGCDR